MIFGDFVVPKFLAVPADLAEWTLAPAPLNATQLLRWATSLVLEATKTAYYDVDVTTGLATDAQIKQALNDMTCVQAAAAAALGFDPITGILTPSTASSKKIGTAQVVYADAAPAAAVREAIINGDLVPEAARIGRLNNLTIPNAWAFG
jgi:hypothetical protein